MAEYVLSTEDRRKLIQLLRDVDKLKSDVRGKGYQDLELNDQLPPEVYVALTPVGGIPALTREDTTGTGTGSGTDIGYRNSPGYADCDVYRLLWDGSVPNMYPTGIVRRVYNFSGVDLPGVIWVIAQRDKYGTWVAVEPAFGGGTKNRHACIVRTPDGGIPALSQSGTTGTGTPDTEDDVPGSATCGVYERVGTVLNDTGEDIVVYNYERFAIPAFQLVLAVRDRYGDWWANGLGMEVGACP